MSSRTTTHHHEPSTMDTALSTAALGVATYWSALRGTKNPLTATVAAVTIMLAAVLVAASSSRS